MVLATEMIMPITSPCMAPQPSSTPTPSPSSDSSTTPNGPPISETHFTSNSSASENSSPMENIRKTTPTSAMTWKVWVSLTRGPRVYGLIAIPASTYPRMSGCRKRHASAPPRMAAMKTYDSSLKIAECAGMQPQTIRSNLGIVDQNRTFRGAQVTQIETRFAPDACLGVECCRGLLTRQLQKLDSVFC